VTAVPEPTSFDAVLEDCLAAIEEQGEGALDAACAAHPQHAERLRRRVHLLAAANLVDLSAGLARIPQRLGDFELLERIGTGGMGVVHRARSVSTGRFVAVKLVRPELLAFSEARSRLAREVELSARLHHESILPVFAVGETEGLPWFAMELVAGASLGAVTSELRRRGRAPADVDTDEVAAIVAELVPPALAEPVDFGRSRPWGEWALDVTRRIVDAIAYAHGKGVLHRDLKPSNVLVGVDGRVHLCDFGLASDAGDGSLTRSGSAVGSLPYMPPEVLDGQAADARSDVYGLGGLAYELATLHRPFEGESTGALVREILTGRPPSPRVHAPKLPLDFEAVVLRALERDPRARYATAAEFGEDLDALVDRRPTRARPIGPLARLVRAAQRRPVAATAVALGCLALVAGPLGWQINQNRSARRVALAYENEVQANERSERHFRAALAAIGSVLRETATEDLEDVPKMQRARLAAIDRASTILTEIAEDRADDRALVVERAELLESRADVLHDMSRNEEALADALACVALLAPFVDGDPDVAMTTCSALHHASEALESLARHGEALVLQEQGLAHVRRLLAADTLPKDVSRREMRRREAVMLLAAAETRRVAIGSAPHRATLEEARVLLEELVRDEPPSDPDPMVRSTFGRVLRDLSDMALEDFDVERAGALLDEAFEHYEEAFTRSPGSRFHVYDLATTYRAQASISSLRGDLETEEAQLLEGLDLLDQLTSDFPESERYYNERAYVLDQLANVYSLTGRMDEARGLFERIYAARRMRVESAEERDEPIVIHDFVTSSNNLANILLLQSQEPERMLEIVEFALEQNARLLDQPEQLFGSRRIERGLRYLQAAALVRAGRLTDARPRIEAFDAAADDALMFRYAADLWCEYLIALPDDEVAVEPGILSNRATAYARVLAALERAVNLGYADLDELQANPALDPVREDPRFEELLARIAAGG